MMMYYSFSQARRLLNVSPATLRRWLRADEVASRPDPLDRRRQVLTRVQVVRLAKLHGRVVIDLPETGLVARVEELEKRVEELERRLLT